MKADKDTICALCTHPGKSAISVIRISGPQSLLIARKQASFLPKKPESHRSYVGVLKRQGQDIDQVIVTFFEQGRSFTGEQTLEISCHGGSVYNEILKGLLQDGARLADRGEFSFQSFCNGKMDLLQAEGLLNLIESRNEISRKHAFKQLRGELSNHLEDIEKKWIFIVAHLEADIDFSMEDLSVISENEIEKNLKNLKKQVSDLLNKYRPIEKLEEGLSCGLFGPVNGGKSSLFNALLEQDKAIVSKEQGTTRDIVSSILRNQSGLNINLQDTAGFRSTKSEGEKQGIQKSKNLSANCDIQIFVFDSLQDIQIPQDLKIEKDSKALLIFTKKDLNSKEITKQDLIKKFKKQSQQKNISDFIKIPNENIFFISSVTKEGLTDLKNKIFSFAAQDEQDDFFITNYRHYKGLKQMESSLQKTFEILTTGLGERDLMALEMREGMLHLFEILGKQVDDQVLDNIFKQFCIGK